MTHAPRQIAIADNRSAEVSLEWDTEMLKALSGDGVDMGPFWTGDEFEKLLPASTDLLTDKAVFQNRRPSRRASSGISTSWASTGCCAGMRPTRRKWRG